MSTPVNDLKEAQARLAEVTAADESAGRHYETDEYTAANQAVIDAEKSVAWWRR